MNSAYELKVRSLLDQANAFTEIASSNTKGFYLIVDAQDCLKRALAGTVPPATKIGLLKSACASLIAAEHICDKPFAVREARKCVEDASRPHCGRAEQGECGLIRRRECAIHAHLPEQTRNPRTRKFLTTAEFKRQGTTSRSNATAVVKEAATANPQALVERIVRFCFSDASVDRVGDKIEVGGWATKDFMRNPTILWAHDGGSPPIGRCKRVFVSGDRLMGDIEFAPPDVSSFADKIFRLVKSAYLKSVSVGFIPVEWKPMAGGGIYFLKQTLLEVSLTPLPANPNALAEVRALGMKGADLERLMKRQN